jgi:hypothetical protein
MAQVKEAREAAREAAALIHQLHQFVSEQGSGGDWPAWASSHLPYSGVQLDSASFVLLGVMVLGQASQVHPWQHKITSTCRTCGSQCPRLSTYYSAVCCMLCRLAVPCLLPSPQPHGKQDIQQLQATQQQAAHVTHRSPLQERSSRHRCHCRARQQSHTGRWGRHRWL